MSAADGENSDPSPRVDFATTQWTIVLATGAADSGASREALAQLCQTYWYPLYAYVRRRLADVHEAQDCTQAFFRNLLENGVVQSADPQRGRFRAFLLTACKRFVINEWHKARALKRGGGRLGVSLDFNSGESKYSLMPVDPLTAEQIFDKQWAITLLERVLTRLRAEYAAKGKEQQFEALKLFLAGATGGPTYAEATQKLGISEAAGKVAAHRLRSRYRELLRAEIAQTIERAEDVDDEIRELFAILGR